jgi:hypothetical protein
MDKHYIRSVDDFIVRVKTDSEGWPHVWFRGEPGGIDTLLLPKLYRPRKDGTKHNENKLLQTFRMRAPIFATAASCPDNEAVDRWLFLAQHVGLPTRLLDWSESALVGLYFALREDKPVVWMLNPMPRPLPLKRAPAVFRRIFLLRWHLWPPEHGVRREADIEHLPQALPGGGERVLREADQHVDTHAVRGASESGF